MTREDQLIKRITDGDASAMEELIQMYYPELLRYCRWHTPDKQSAEDAVHETFLKLLRHWDGYIHRGKFRAYLYRIAANICTDMYRSHWNTDISLPEGLTTQENGYQQAEQEADFLRLTALLPEQQRELVILRYAQQFKLREIAQITGLPLRTVQSRLRAALKTLKSKLSEEGWQ